MEILTILLLSVGLAMDAFAVSISCGLANEDKVIKNAIKVGGAFGFFQGAMTYIGWLLGFSVKAYIQSIDHWIALILLVIIGTKMIIEAKNEDCSEICLTSFKTLLTLSVATSIDAMAAGLSLTSFNMNIAFPVVSIAVITYVLSFIGFLIGKRIGCNRRFKSGVDILGGVILISIGLKIFIQHMFM